MILTFWKISACPQRLTSCICCAGSSSSFIQEWGWKVTSMFPAYVEWRHYRIRLVRCGSICHWNLCLVASLELHSCVFLSRLMYFVWRVDESVYPVPPSYGFVWLGKFWILVTLCCPVVFCSVTHCTKKSLHPVLEIVVQLRVSLLVHSTHDQSAGSQSLGDEIHSFASSILLELRHTGVNARWHGTRTSSYPARWYGADRRITSRRAPDRSLNEQTDACCTWLCFTNKQNTPHGAEEANLAARENKN